MNWFNALISNYALRICVLSWFSAQFIKFILNLIIGHKAKFERLYGAGGMPSSHTALVTALVMGVAKMCGIGSAEFVIAGAFAMVTIYDAMGVRRQAGEHAKLLNKIIDSEDYLQGENGEEDRELKELLGHTPIEVLGGAMVGILVSMLVKF